MIKKIKNVPELLSLAVVMIYYFILSLHRFMQAPLWGDEIAEYYCSVWQKGPIHGVTDAVTMYERMATIQQQPPLYNWVLGVWIQLSNSEFWIRFSSVVFCFFGIIGLYLVMRRLTNRWLATVATIVFVSLYQFQYYVKEAAEYALLIPLLMWTIYSFVCILDKVTWRRVILFTALCVASVYTQYGAVFVIVPMALQVLYHCGINREWVLLKKTVLTYAIAVIGAGIPLVLLFLVPQSTNKVSTLMLDHNIEFEKNIVYDFLFGFVRLLDWQMLDYDRDGARMMPVMWLLAIGFIVVGCVLIAKRKDKIFNTLFCTCLITYILYYCCLKVKIYSYGWFGTRYCLFFMPILFVTIIYMIWISLHSLKEFRVSWSDKLQIILRIALVVVALVYCCYGVYRVDNHWWKSDERAVVDYWYENECYNEFTFVDFKQRLTFKYYLEVNDRFETSYWDKIYINTNSESAEYTVDEWLAYFECEGIVDTLPESFYVSTGYYTALIQALESVGYCAEAVVDTTTDFYYLTRRES